MQKGQVLVPTTTGVVLYFLVYVTGRLYGLQNMALMRKDCEIKYLQMAAGGAVNNGQSNTRRRCGCPPHVKGQHGVKQQEVQFKVYDVVDLKQQQRPRGPRPRTRSQQLFYDHNQNNTTNNFDQNQKRQHCPKHSATARPSTTAAATTNTVAATAASAVNVKPVDEDLYKIPPELLLQNSKRKKMLGFISKCLAPPCKA